MRRLEPTVDGAGGASRIALLGMSYVQFARKGLGASENPDWVWSTTGARWPVRRRLHDATARG